MITKNFIKMCERNEDLQREWKPKKYDFYYNITMKHVFMIREYNDIKLIDEPERIYLPTQEQLQEMMEELSNKHFFEDFPKNYIPQKGEYVFPIHLLWWFSQWVVFQKRSETKEHSLNALWLAFMMYEKYHKTWTGEKWVKAE